MSETKTLDGMKRAARGKFHEHDAEKLYGVALKATGRVDFERRALETLPKLKRDDYREAFSQASAYLYGAPKAKAKAAGKVDQADA